MPYERCPITEIRTRVRSESDWPSEAPGLTLCFEVSVNNPSCAGDRLRSQILWARDRFSSFVFSVGDTLNRHNYDVLGHPTHGKLGDKAAHEVAREEGDLWMATHEKMIKADLDGASVVVQRWDDWLADQLVRSAYSYISAKLDEHPEFLQAVETDVSAFVRRKRRSRPPSKDEFVRLSRHLIEEAAVYLVQLASEPTMILYPGSMASTWEYLIKGGGPPPDLAGLHYRYLELRE